MKRISSILVAAMIVCSVAAMAQMPEPRKPGAEEKNLAYFAGNWKLDGNLKGGPMGPNGKFTESEHNEFLAGGFYLVSHSEGTSPMGKDVGMAIFGYDPQMKVYTYAAYNNMGEAEHATGTFDGTTWTWSSELNMGGQSAKSRFVITQTSPTSYDFKFEISQNGTNWTGMMDGKATKAGGATKK